MEEFLIQYGYIAIFLAALVQGKSVALAAGMIAHHGEVDLVWAIVAVIAGSYVCDLMFFTAGRTLGPKLYEHRPRWKQRAERTHKLLLRDPLLLIMSYRLLPGVRFAAPAFIGATPFSAARFLILDFFSALIGMSILTLAGFGFGKVLVKFFANARDWEITIAIAIAVLAAVGIFLLERRHHRNFHQRAKTQSE